MKKPLVLTSTLLVLLAGCATQPHTTVRRGKIIKLDAPAAQAAPVATPAAPVAKPVTVTAKPALAAPVVATKPAAPAPAAAPAVTVKPAPAVVVSPAASAPAPVVVKPAAPVLPAIPAVSADKPLATSRAGAIVQVSWVLPPSDIGYKGIEIMRNERSEASGRARVRAVRSTVTNLQDTVPDANADYWYWIKLTRQDGQIQNIGPVAAPKN